MHRLVRSWWGRQLKLVLGFHLFFIGCGDERQNFFILNDVVLTVDRAPVATIQEAPAAQLARLDATAQAADIVITQMTVQTSHPSYGAFVTTNDGVVGKSIQVDPFTVNDPTQFQFSVRQSLLNIQPTNGRNALLRLDQIGQVEQMSLFFNTLGLDDEVVNFRVLSITASSASSPPKEIPLPGLNFTLLVTAPPLVLAEAIQPVRVHVARGASEVLAEVVLTELSNEHSVVLQLMEARFDKALIGLNPRLVDRTITEKPTASTVRSTPRPGTWCNSSTCSNRFIHREPRFSFTGQAGFLLYIQRLTSLSTSKSKRTLYH